MNGPLLFFVIFIFYGKIAIGPSGYAAKTLVAKMSTANRLAAKYQETLVADCSAPSLTCDAFPDTKQFSNTSRMSYSSMDSVTVYLKSPERPSLPLLGTPTLSPNDAHAH